MNNEIHNLLKKMNRIFWIWACIDLTVFVLIFFLHRAGVSPELPSQALWVSGIVLLVLTAAGSIAAPIMIRSLYVSRTLKARRFFIGQYESIQILLVSLSMAAALIAGVSYLLLVPKLHLYAAMIAALYGVYSAIPSKKKIQGEINYFEARCR